MLEIERRAALAVVVEREHARVVGVDDPVLERRIRRSEHVRREPALEPNDLGPEVRKVLPDERSRGGEAHLDDPKARERALMHRRRGLDRELGHTVPDWSSRASSSGPTPISA